MFLDYTFRFARNMWRKITDFAKRLTEEKEKIKPKTGNASEFHNMDI